MKLAIIGYGRMGHIIEELAKKRGHEIVCTIDVDEEFKFEQEQFLTADAAIEFTTPTSAVDNLKRCIKAQVPVICGTTGWLDALPDVEKLCNENNAKLIHASNFSIGVNLFWAFNRYMASVMQKFEQYKPSLSETHHIHKLDHPSGTAITTALQTIKSDELLKEWKETSEAVDDTVLAIKCIREGEVPGIHSMIWDSEEDSIELTHSAKSRHGFAKGAIMAAEWIINKPANVYNISDMLADVTKTSAIF